MFSMVISALCVPLESTYDLYHAPQGIYADLPTEENEKSSSWQNKPLGAKNQGFCQLGLSAARAQFTVGLDCEIFGKMGKSKCWSFSVTELCVCVRILHGASIGFCHWFALALGCPRAALMVASQSCPTSSTFDLEWWQNAFCCLPINFRLCIVHPLGFVIDLHLPRAVRAGP